MRWLLHRTPTTPVPTGSAVVERLGRSFRSTASHRSAWSIGSLLSFASMGSIASALSVGSIGSAGSVLSIGSTGSILSIGSAGCVLSIGSTGSILSIGSAGDRDPTSRLADHPDADGGAAGRPHRLTIRRGATLLGMAALLAAISES